jgi:hypothetical protein
MAKAEWIVKEEAGKQEPLGIDGYMDCWILMVTRYFGHFKKVVSYARRSAYEPGIHERG